MASIGEQARALLGLPAARLRARKAMATAERVGSLARGANLYRAYKEGGNFIPSGMRNEFLSNPYVLNKLKKK